MPDRDKVIRGLEYCMGGCKVSCFKCPYREIGHQPPDCLDNCMILQDAVDLLKEQEPRPVQITQRFPSNKYSFEFHSGNCPWCGEYISSNCSPNFCGKCGQAVKWDESKNT